MARRCCERDDSREVIDQKRGMRFLRRAEIVLDSDVQLEGAGAIPESASLALVGGLGDLGEPKNAAVEQSRAIFFADWDGDLNVVKSDSRHAMNDPQIKAGG